MVDCTGLENRRTERYRGFESLPLRQSQRNELQKQQVTLIFCLMVRQKIVQTECNEAGYTDLTSNGYHILNPSLT